MDGSTEDGSYLWDGVVRGMDHSSSLHLWYQPVPEMFGDSTKCSLRGVLRHCIHWIDPYGTSPRWDRVFAVEVSDLPRIETEFLDVLHSDSRREEDDPQWSAPRPPPRIRPGRPSGNPCSYRYLPPPLSPAAARVGDIHRSQFHHLPPFRFPSSRPCSLPLCFREVGDVVREGIREGIPETREGLRTRDRRGTESTQPVESSLRVVSVPGAAPCLELVTPHSPSSAVDQVGDGVVCLVHHEDVPLHSMCIPHMVCTHEGTGAVLRRGEGTTTGAAPTEAAGPGTGDRTGLSPLLTVIGGECAE